MDKNSGVWSSALILTGARAQVYGQKFQDREKIQGYGKAY